MIKNNRILWLDSLRGLAMIFVVCGHIFTSENIVRWLYTFHLALFFFVGGYSFCIYPLHISFLKRCKRLLLPYIIAGCSSQIYYSMVQFWCGNASFLSNPQIYFKLLYGSYGYITFNRVIWFLPAYFLMSVLTDYLFQHMGIFLKKYGKEQLTIFVLFVVAIICRCVWCCCDVPELPLGGRDVMQMWIYYIAGMYLGQNICLEYIDKKLKNKKILISLCAYAISVLNCFILKFDILQGVLTAICGIGGSIFLAMIIQNIRLIRLIGQNTLVILCTHMILFHIYQNIMEHSRVNLDYMPKMYDIVGVFFVIFVAVFGKLVVVELKGGLCNGKV